MLALVNNQVERKSRRQESVGNSGRAPAPRILNVSKQVSKVFPNGAIKIAVAPLSKQKCLQQPSESIV